MSRKMSRRNKVFFIKAGFFTILFVALATFWCSFPYWTSETQYITVTDKERITTSNGETVSSKYLVFTDSETFENSDCFVLFKFDSSDIQGQLKEGGNYKVEVYGWRVPWMSWYRNIVSVRKWDKDAS